MAGSSPGRQQSDSVVVVTAATLQDAYRRIRRDHGDQAEVLDTRNVPRHGALGPGRDRLVEVTVRVPGADGMVRPAVAVPDAPGVEDLLREVERIEAMLAELEAAAVPPPSRVRSPLAVRLEKGGARAATVDHLLARFVAETGRASADRAAFLAWLKANLPASNCGWDGFYGRHAFLGAPGCGRTELVLAAAARLQAAGRRTLVLAMTAGEDDLIRRLQRAASDGGYDAALLRRPELLQENAAGLDGYDAVLVDLPPLAARETEPGGALHRWLSADAGFHRHLVIPLDGDTGDLVELAPAARTWNCDWLAVSRTDRSRRWAKLLDLTVAIGLPFSLLAGDPRRGGALEIAASGQLLDRVLGGAGADTGDPSAPGSLTA